MPLTKIGERTLKNFQKQYGEKKGEEYFYSWLNKKTPKRREKYEKDK